MNYFISGQSGFIGQAITKYLVNDNVIPIPRFSLLRMEELKKLFKADDPDFIIHLASYGNHYYQKNFKAMAEANIICTYNLLEATKGIDYNLFYNISTSSVNLKQQTLYSITKYAREQLCNLYERVVNIRPYSIYGPGEASHRFIPLVIAYLKTGEQMIVDENATHDWIFIDDFIEALFAGETEIGTGIKTTNKEIIMMLQDISGKKLNYIKGKLRDYDNNDWVSPKTVKSIGIYEGLKKSYDSTI